MRTLITNGTVITPQGSHELDVLVEGEQIAALLQPGSVCVAWLNRYCLVISSIAQPTASLSPSVS